MKLDELLGSLGKGLDEVEGALDRVLRQARESGDQVLRQARESGDQVLRQAREGSDRVLRQAREGSGWLLGRSHTTVGDLMTRSVRSCGPDDALAEAGRALWEGDCGCVPVVADGPSERLVGVLTDRDVCMAAWTTGARLPALRVRDAMATSLHTCGPDDPVSHALELMSEAQVRRLPVLDETGRLVGILSLADVARASADPASGVDPEDVGEALRAICATRSGSDAEGTATH